MRMRRLQAGFQLAISVIRPFAPPRAPQRGAARSASHVFSNQLVPSLAFRHLSRPFSQSNPRRADDGNDSDDTADSGVEPANDLHPASLPPIPDPPSSPGPAYLTPPEIPSGSPITTSRISPDALEEMYGAPAEPETTPDVSWKRIATNFAPDSHTDADGSEPGVPGDTGIYHFNVYSHKHNTHVTVAQPNHNPIISMSCGNLGFRKSKRKTYDAAYQLTAYVLQRLEKTEWVTRIQRMELVLRGFGHGREAAAKVLVSSEGTLWKKKIVRVADATRIKFGGNRSPNPRRV